MANRFDREDVDISRQLVVDPPPQRLGRVRRVNVEMRDLFKRMYAGIGAARAVELEVLLAGCRVHGTFDLALHGARVLLNLPAGVAGAGVLDGELEPHASLLRHRLCSADRWMSPRPVRRFAVGAEVQSNGTTHFRVWAPAPKNLTLLLERKNQPCESVELEREPNGYYSGSAAATAGDRYRYRLDDRVCPDPASRAQPEGPLGPSEIVDDSSFSWN